MADSSSSLPPLFEKISYKRYFLRAVDLTMLGLLFSLLLYRILHMSQNDNVWVLAFLCESFFTFIWLLVTCIKWTPAEYKPYPDRLDERVHELPSVDMFVTTADPVKEPPILVVNTVLSLLAVNYPANKLACYVSDDGCSPLTYFSLKEASNFSKIWVPFCKKYNVRVRAPFTYFLNPLDATEDSEFRRDWEMTKVDVISMVVDTAHTEEELMWDDEVNDELVDNLVRLIQQGHRFDKSMFVGGLTAAALTRMRAERKLKEAKDKKERDSHSNVNSPDGDIGDAYHPTLIANLVGRMVTQQIDDAVYKLVGKLEDRLAVVIKAELLNMQAVVSQSIIGHLGNFKPIGAENEDNTGCVPQVDQNPTDCTSPQPAPEPATTGGKPTVLQTAIPEHQSVLVFDQPRADTVINKVISDVKCFTEQSEVFATDVMTHTPITEQLDAEDVNNMVDDVPDTPMDTDFTTPLCGQKTSFIHHQLSPVSEEEKNYHNEEDVSRTELLPGAVHIPVGNVDIGETRKSRRTRILPPLFNDYQCDPKIKAFRVEQPPITSADNINEIYMSMRESAGLNKVYNVGNGIAVTTEELNDVVDRTLQMPPKVMDALMYYIALERDRKRIHSSRIAIHDTNFPALLMKQHARLVKCAVRDRCRLKYDADVLKYFRGPTNSADGYERIYFPFCIDKQHWIGVCLDVPGATVQILDCNYGFRTDGMLKKDMNPITIVVPHILNAAAGNLGPNQRKQYEMIRLPGVPQNPISTDAATTTALLIQAHALNKADGCKEITQDSLSAGAKHLAVLVYRDVAPL